MDNRISQIRRQIRALRISMLEAEAIMREQINQDQECSFVAGELLKMRTVMRVLVHERSTLGDKEPVLVNSIFVARRHRIAAVRSAGQISEAQSVIPR